MDMMDELERCLKMKLKTWVFTKNGKPWFLLPNVMKISGLLQMFPPILNDASRWNLQGFPLEKRRVVAGFCITR